VDIGASLSQRERSGRRTAIFESYAPVRPAVKHRLAGGRQRPAAVTFEIPKAAVT